MDVVETRFAPLSSQLGSGPSLFTIREEVGKPTHRPLKLDHLKYGLTGLNFDLNKRQIQVYVASGTYFYVSMSSYVYCTGVTACQPCHKARVGGQYGANTGQKAPYGGLR